MPEADALAKLDVLYDGYVQQQSWEQAVRNRSQAASIAHMRGRTDLFRQYIQQAIDLSGVHDLERTELRECIARFNYLLRDDLTNQVLDELQGELNCELSASGAELTGALSEKLERHCSAALAAYDALLATPAQSPAALTTALKLAGQKAAAFSFSYLQGQFDQAVDSLDKGEATTAEVSGRIQKAASGARSETSRICASLRVDLFLLVAELRRKLGDSDTAEDAFHRAEELSTTLPEKRFNVYMAWADHCDGRGKLKPAADYARKAVEAAEQTSFAALKVQAELKLANLLARETSLAELPSSLQGSGATDRVMWIVENAHQALLEHRFGDSLRLVNQAFEQASTPQLRRAVLRQRALALCELGRLAEAETDFDECISHLSDELSSDAAVAAGAFDSRIREEENLYLMKAFIRAKAGRGVESWGIAEQGRSRRLKREIASTGFPPAMFEDASFDAVRGWLHLRRAAVLSFAATPWGTLALTAGPDDLQPESQILDQFPVRELNRLLKSDQRPESEAWTNIILDSIPGLSAGLIHPLLPRLRTITEGARVLYIIPDGLLYYAPFAALTLDTTPNSPALIDLCPLAITPSSAVLLWCASRPLAAPSRDCLAVASGESQGFEFHNHLTQIASAPWPNPPVELRDGAATPAMVAAQAPKYSVLYFSCHGFAAAPDSRDLMASSQLELAGKSRLSARDVSTWKLRADLVFLNACQSGRFSLQARSDVNGFVRAFPLAGTKSLIAPLIHVDPGAAGDLAEWFFKAWLAGSSKVEALRTAQLVARQEDPDRKDWATYFLIGDFL